MPRQTTVVESLAWLLADEEETLAHGLHDDVHPSLAAIRMSLEAARHGASPATTLATVDASLSALEGWARAQQGRVRASLLKRMTLCEALFWYAARLEEERGAEITVVDESARTALPFPVALALLGHVQEQLHHHVRSSANSVSIRLWADAQVFGISTRVTKAEGSAKAVRFARLAQAMGGVLNEHPGEGELTISLTVPRV